MPVLTMTSRDTCPVCGCRLRGVLIGSFRVNLHSLRRTGSSPSLVAQDLTCPECRHPSPPVERWALRAESQQLVNAARAKKSRPRRPGADCCQPFSPRRQEDSGAAS